MIPQMKRKVKFQIGKVQDRASKAQIAVQAQGIVFGRDYATRCSSKVVIDL